jgi:hypothetical protein
MRLRRLRSPAAAGVVVGLAVALWPGVLQAAPAWDRFEVLMWHYRTPAQMKGLKAIGFTGAMLLAGQGRVDQAAKAARAEAGLSWYLENVATDFYSPYHRYTEGKTVTWLFDAAKAKLKIGDVTAFEREPGLSDPVWLDRIRARLGTLAQQEQGSRPLFYNMADEAGIGDLAAAWDADQSRTSLAGFRIWLQAQYPSLPALNQQWGTDYASWDVVMPELTAAALRRTDGNFSAWSDFKAWMDVAFARAVRTGTEALHAADPQARSALEGGQVPGWGGYDYSLLAPALDVMEIYDIGNALDLATAFNPALVPLRTSFGSGMREAHAAWRSVLHGGRGMVVWDEADSVVQADGTPGPRGKELAALIPAINAVAPKLASMQPDFDPVAVLYSPASFRVRWLLDRQDGDHDWATRDAEREYDDNAWRASRRILLQRLAELGVQPRHVSGAMLAGLRQSGVRVLFLPHAIALSDQDVADIQTFRAAGGTVLADTEPGLFDGHGRRRSTLPLPDVARPESVRPTGADSEPGTLLALAKLLQDAGAPPRTVFLGPDGERATGVEARWFRSGDESVLAIQSARPWGGPPQIELRLSHPAQITDLRQSTVLTDPGPIRLQLDAIEPSILSLRP